MGGKGLGKKDGASSPSSSLFRILKGKSSADRVTAKLKSKSMRSTLKVLVPWSFQAHSRGIPGPFQAHSKLIPGSFQDDSWVIPGSFHGHSRLLPRCFQRVSRTLRGRSKVGPVCLCMYVRRYLCMYVCMYVCMYIRMYVCVYVCMLRMYVCEI